METVTYYFDGYDVGGEEWDYNPDKVVDGNEHYLSYGHTNTPGEIQLCNSNTCDGTDIGTIWKVEMRVCAMIHDYFDDPVRLTLRPVFSGGDGDNHEFSDLGQSVLTEWSEYVDITSDTNAPSSWTWTDVQNLDMDLEKTDDINISIRVTKVELRVTYGPKKWVAPIFIH